MKTSTRVAILIICAISSVAIGYLLLDKLYPDTQPEWRSITPGTHISVVREKYGAEDLFIASGETMDAFRESHVITEYKKSHNVYIYTIGGYGPELLYVFTNDEDIVTFVISKST